MEGTIRKSLSANDYSLDNIKITSVQDCEQLIKELERMKVDLNNSQVKPQDQQQDQSYGESK